MADKQVAYEIRADVKGRESITGLADDLDEVSKVLSSDLAPQAQAAAARLRDLAQQEAAINAFNRLKTETRDAGRALKDAEAEAAAYGKQIAAMGPPTAQEAAALQRLQSAADGARVTFTQQQQALAGAQAELQRYGIAGQNTQAAQKRLAQEVTQVRESVQGMVPAYQGAASAAQTAGGGMTRTHRQIGDGVESISQQLGRLQSFYAGLAGIQGLKSMAADLAATADEVNNLQGRIKLVTGEGENFKQSWQGVTEVALRTHSALQETGTLFTRLAQAGKDAGLSTAQASAQSLALTETINQAIQLSGAGAQASSAAITQLVQGLQGGALRGEEFNSVMEQSPRLAKALADGLGVTTGELRNMAQAGALTSDTVIKALQGQSDTVAAEFKKLPPTVGRALQDLSTQWALYVGEADKASGASTAAATAINALAGNLQTIAGLLIDAGQAALAFTALRLAQHFLGIGTAAQGAATAIAAANTQVAAAGNAAVTAATGVGRFATILAGLRTFTLIGLAVNFKDIGTWIGESAAKLAGYKDRTEELAQAEKRHAENAKEAAADRARLAASIQAAIDKQFELSNAARAGITEFERLTKAGTSSAEAIKKVSESFDLSKVQGVRDFSAVLDKLAADGKASASEIEKAWAQALNGKDLAQFEVTARAAFSGAAREGERVAQMMDAVLRESVRRTGLDFDVLQGKMGAAARSAINDVDAVIGGLDKLKEQGLDTGQVLTASLSKAINTADSEKALEVIRAKIEQVRQVLGDKIADGLLDQAKEKANALKDALDKATPGINGVREAMKLLGITSDESLKKTAATAKESYDTMVASGTNSARELGEGFKKAAEAAIAAGNGVAPAWVKADAAVRGYRVVIDASGKATLELADQTEKATGRMAKGWQTAREAVQAQEDAMDRLLMKYTMSADYTERQIKLLEREAAAAEKAAEAYRKKWNMDKEGYALNTAGERVMGGESQDQVDKSIAEMYGAENVGNPDAQRARQLRVLGRLRSKGNGLVTQRDFSADERRELDQLEAKLRNGIGAATAPAKAPSQSPTQSAPTYSAVINLPGLKSATARFDSPGEQANLQAILGALSRAAGVAQ